MTTTMTTMIEPGRCIEARRRPGGGTIMSMSLPLLISVALTPEPAA
jgi:hypothetical protein